MAYFDVSHMKETEGSRMQEVLTTLLYSVWSILCLKGQEE